jgi:O-antigen ligase
MKQFLILIGTFPFAVIPILLLLQIKSDMRNYYLFVSIFTNQLFLVFIFGINLQSIYDGASIFVNLTILYISIVPLAVILLSRRKVKLLTLKPRYSLNNEILRWSWLLVFLFGSYAAVVSKAKLMPITTTFMFGIILFTIMQRDYSFDLMIISVYRIFGLISGLLNLSFIFKFDWTRFVVQTVDSLNLNSSVYFSPLGSLFGLPPRVYGPFAGGQISAIFSLVGIACYLASSFPKKNPISLISLVAFGSFSGSRTFYLTLTCLMTFHLVKRILPKGNVQYWLTLILGLGATASVLFFFLLPVISPDNQTSTNFTGRSALWAMILEDWNNNGILGQGPNTLTNYSIAKINFPYAHAHNSLLQLLWDFGVPGVLSFALIIWTSCVEAAKTQKGRNEVMGIVLTLMCIQTEPTIHIGINLIGWFWLIPLLYVYSSNHNQESVDVSKKK